MSFKKNLKRWEQKDEGGDKMVNRKGQSTLEYVLILTAIIGAVVLASKMVGTKVQNSLEHVSNEMESQVGRIHFGPQAVPQTGQ
jgi:Flp pilus assembly pilin Flp